MDDIIRILMLEDAEEDVELIEHELKRAGMPFSIQRVQTKNAFEEMLESFQPHIVLSDYLLESFDGLSALALARAKHPHIPFLFVSWEIHEDSVIDIMKRGATDYVFKSQLSRLPLSVFRAIHEADERRELQKAIERIIEQERLGALGQMASGIAHDFSNALMPVLGYSELLINHPANQQDQKKLNHFLNMINTSAKDAMNIVNRLRAFYRRRENVEKLLPVNLNQIVEQVILFAQPKWKGQAQASGVTIQVKTDLQNVPEILANETAIREALANIIFNAIDAMPEGGTIRFVTYHSGDFVVLEISDTGVGMDEEVRKHCFEPFYSTKGKSGTGMGLSMVYGVIRRHEGTIDIESAPGAGTKFIIRLPQSKITHKKEEGKNGADEKAFKPERKLNVLAVDDEPGVLAILLEYLRGDGHMVETASSVVEGWSKFEQGNYDVVITDWAMPGLNGDELITRIKQKSPETAIILLSGFGELLETGGLKPQGVTFLMSKPPTIAALREAISRTTSKNP